jgi:hypothetical protein
MDLEGEPPMIYVLMFAVLWAAVGALVFFVRTSMRLRRRLGLTIGTSLVFGIVGWFDVSSIVQSDPTVMARRSVRPDHPITEARAWIADLASSPGSGNRNP